MAIHSSKDYDFFYAGLAEKQILVQRCQQCEKLRNPPSPACASCGSLEWAPFEIRGRGTVNSFTVHHYPPLADFPVPHILALVDMDAGIRLLGGMHIAPPVEPAIGMRVQARFDDALTTPVYRFYPVPTKAAE